MKEISDRLHGLIEAFAKMKYPSPAGILRKHGYRYEAERLDEILACFEEERDKGADHGTAHGSLRE